MDFMGYSLALNTGEGKKSKKAPREKEVKKPGGLADLRWMFHLVKSNSKPAGFYSTHHQFYYKHTKIRFQSQGFREKKTSNMVFTLEIVYFF
jgi:hypothetical protein